jgi:hypothetical protein
MFRIFEKYIVKRGNDNLGEWYVQSVQGNEIGFYKHEDGMERQHMHVQIPCSGWTFILVQNTPFRF